MKNKILVIALIIWTLSACKKDNSDPSYSLDKHEVSLVHDGTSQLKVNEATNEVFTYSSKNDFIASVNSDGLITGERVGETVIRITYNSYKDSCTVLVRPIYNTFKEPITTYGLTKSEIRQKELRLFGTETTSGLLFFGANSEKYVIYLFDANGKSTTSCIVLSSAYTSELAKYMIERYLIVSSDPVGGLSVDQNFAITTELQTSLDWWVIYFPAKLTKSAAIDSSAREISKLIELIKDKH